MTIIVFVAIWAAMALLVAFLAAYRIVVAWRENDIIHLKDGELGEAAEQSVIGHKIEWADHWGQTLTVVTLVYGLILAGIYLYGVVMDSSLGMQ